MVISFGHRKKYVLYSKCSVCTVSALCYSLEKKIFDCLNAQSTITKHTYMNIIIVISKGIDSLKPNLMSDPQKFKPHIICLCDFMNIFE